MSLQIKIKRLPHAQGLKAPHKATPGSSGCDICAAIEGPLTVLPGHHALIPTGFCCEIPHGYEVQVRSRSGLALKNGVMVLNSPGTIDSDYRGEVNIILANLGAEPFTINRGDRIAQLVPMAIPMRVDFVESEDLSDTDRGAGGFGHSGV